MRLCRGFGDPLTPVTRALHNRGSSRCNLRHNYPVPPPKLPGNSKVSHFEPEKECTRRASEDPAKFRRQDLGLGPSKVIAERSDNLHILHHMDLPCNRRRRSLDRPATCHPSARLDEYSNIAAHDHAAILGWGHRLGVRRMAHTTTKTPVLDCCNVPRGNVLCELCCVDHRRSSTCEIHTPDAGDDGSDWCVSSVVARENTSSSRSNERWPLHWAHRLSSTVARHCWSPDLSVGLRSKIHGVLRDFMWPPGCEHHQHCWHMDSGQEARCKGWVGGGKACFGVSRSLENGLWDNTASVTVPSSMPQGSVILVKTGHLQTMSRVLGIMFNVRKGAFTQIYTATLRRVADQRNDD